MLIWFTVNSDTTELNFGEFTVDETLPGHSDASCVNNSLMPTSYERPSTSTTVPLIRELSVMVKREPDNFEFSGVTSSRVGRRKKVPSSFEFYEL